MFVATVVLISLSRIADDVPGALDVLSDTSWPWLTAAITVELGCYVLLGFQLSRLLGGVRDFGRFFALQLALVIYGLGTLLPGAPAPGMVLAGRQLSRRGVEASQSSLAFFLSAWFNVRSFLILAVLTALLATLRGRVPDDWKMVVIGSALFVALGLVLLEALLKRPVLFDRSGRFVEWVNWRGNGQNARETALRFHAAAISAVASRRDGFVIGSATFGSRLADVICLRFAMLSIGIHVSMGVVLIAYIVSALISALPLLPGGLGIIDATIPAVLHYYGAPLDSAVAGTVVWRSATLLLPGLLGLVSYAWMKARPTPEMERWQSEERRSALPTDQAP